MFLMDLKTLLWLFLFIVPGVIKAYEYSMIPYLLAENPNLSASEAFSLSKQMTTGQKADLFVLDLSFLGWIILGHFVAELDFYLYNHIQKQQKLKFI